jgi:hypothetical protein
MCNSGELCSGTSVAASNTKPRQEFLFPGEEEFAETAAGTCYLREQRFSLKLNHGSGLLAEILNSQGEDLALAARDGSLVGFQPERSLFLDIETTGLSGGTGTWVVLIGLGWLKNDEFYLRQYFLRHPSEEKAMLLHFTETVAGFPSLVTFNGKIFDLPMIQARQILTGLLLRTVPYCHIDLLPCSRRLWKERLGSCSLRSLEAGLLGLRRHDDIPGEEIPAAYFNYLRSGDTTRLREIFQHNVLDILSMVRLLTCVARATAGDEPEHPADNFALGKLFYENGQVKEAVSCYKKAACCGNERLEQAALLCLSFVYKRQGKWKEATALWNELLGRFPQDLTPYLELAKYYEHRAGDCQAALALTEQALARTQHGFSISASGQLSGSALHHRQLRLKRKTGQSVYNI